MPTVSNFPIISGPNIPMCLSRSFYCVRLDGTIMIHRNHFFVHAGATYYPTNVRYFSFDPSVHCIQSNESSNPEHIFRACCIGLVSLRILTGADLEIYYNAIKLTYGPKYAESVRKEVQKRIARLLEPLMRVRRRLFRVRCVARRWADRWWSPYTEIGKLRLMRSYAELSSVAPLHHAFMESQKA